MRLNTPIETYKIGKHEVLVKRDDLMGDNKSLPPWGKMKAIDSILQTMDLDRPLMQLNVFGSWSGWALANLAKKYDCEVHVVHPKTKKITDDYLEKLDAAGAVVRPIRHNMMRVLYSQTKNMADSEGFKLLPYAFNNATYLNHMARRLRNTLEELGPIDNLVVSSGSGVTLTGLTKPFLDLNPKGKVYTVCVSSEDSIKKTLNGRSVQGQIHVVKSPYEFSDTMPKFSTPFPCNQFWDKKAWYWLTENSQILKKKRTLFWNLGGEYTFL